MADFDSETGKLSAMNEALSLSGTGFLALHPEKAVMYATCAGEGKKGRERSDRVFEHFGRRHIGRAQSFAHQERGRLPCLGRCYGAGGLCRQLRGRVFGVLPSEGRWVAVRAGFLF